MEDIRQYTTGLRQRGFGASGSYLGYERIDFGTGVTGLKVMASGHAAGKATFDVTIEFRLDSHDGQLIGTVLLPRSPEESVMRQHIIELVWTVSGIRDIYVVNASPPNWHFINFDGFVFE